MAIPGRWRVKDACDTDTEQGDRAFGMPGFYRLLLLTADAICLPDKHHVDGTEWDHFTRGLSLITPQPPRVPRERQSVDQVRGAHGLPLGETGMEHKGDKTKGCLTLPGHLSWSQTLSALSPSMAVCKAGLWGTWAGEGVPARHLSYPFQPKPLLWFSQHILSTEAAAEASGPFTAVTSPGSPAFPGSARGTATVTARVPPGAVPGDPVPPHRHSPGLRSGPLSRAGAP